MMKFLNGMSFHLVHLFYMKTCAFRFARPRTMEEGLFCLKTPEARYDLTACGNCGLCYPRSRKSVVQFNQAHRYRFLNGYEAILNCSAVCLQGFDLTLVIGGLI